jgi:hypothetical protein
LSQTARDQPTRECIGKSVERMLLRIEQGKGRKDAPTTVGGKPARRAKGSAQGEYHRERFQDFSLVIPAGDHVSALFPANRDGDTVISHAGLTFGGLVLDRRATAGHVVAMLSAIVELLRFEGIRTLVYKTIPIIYHSVPTEEDRYALFRFGAQVVRRDVLTVISPLSPWQPSSKRRWSWNRARRLTGVHLGLQMIGQVFGKCSTSGYARNMAPRRHIRLRK